MQISEPYAVVVDYGLSLEQMIAAGHYGYVNPDITPEHFPVTRTRVTVDTDAMLVHLDHSMSTDDALLELDHLGLRPGDLPELLALGAKHPDLQRSFPIVELASVWTFGGGYRYVADLCGYAHARSLNLFDVALVWFDDCRFLAFRK